MNLPPTDNNAIKSKHGFWSGCKYITTIGHPYIPFARPDVNAILLIIGCLYQNTMVIIRQLLFRVVPARKLFMLILGTLTICRKGRIGSFAF